MAATIVPVGVAFALLHIGNPNATWLGIANTAGFGVLFGYAYLRSRDLWLPVGLHFGWNFTLPLFGVNVSGLKMNVTGYEMSWTAGRFVERRRIRPGGQRIDLAVMVILLFVLSCTKRPFAGSLRPSTDSAAENSIMRAVATIAILSVLPL